MKSLRVRFPPTSEAFADTYAFLDDGDSAQGELRDIRLHDDGTLTELCLLTNPPEDVEARAADAPHVHECSSVPTRDGAVLLHTTLTPDDTIRDLLGLVETHQLSLDMPIILGPNGVTATVVGPDDRLTDAMNDLPDELSGAVTIDSITSYQPEATGLRDALTERQRAVLDAAVDLGYYDTPRRATIEDLAADLGLASSTVSEHLRKLEARALPCLT